MVRGDTTQTAALRAVTDAGSLTHLMSDEAMVVGRRLGRDAACCGAEILAASLTDARGGAVPPVPPLEGRGVTASTTQLVRSERSTTQAQPVSTAPSAPAGPDPATTDSGLAVLVLQVSWALADASHDLPAGRLPPRRREELADTLSALGYVLRASAPAPDGER